MNCVRRFRIKDYFVNVIQLMQFVLSILTLDVKQNAGIHWYHQRNVARDTNDSGVVMSPQDL